MFYGPMTSAAMRDVTLPGELEYRALQVVPDGSRCRGGGIWSRSRLPPGVRYGPFCGELRERATDPAQAWEIVDSTGKVKGWLDGSMRGNWLRHVSSTNDVIRHNVMAVQVEEKVYYEIRRWIEAGEELLLYRGAGLLQEKDMVGMQQERTDIKRFPCAKCGEFFKSKVALRRHETYVCNNKHAIFSSINQKFKAKQSKAEDDISDSSLIIDDYATYENKKKENDEQEFACENCPSQFSSVLALQQHITSRHPGARCHACQECGKTFATGSGLKQHMHIHSSVKPFQCEVCSKSYTQFSNLCRHKRMHSTCRVQLQCEDCLQTFSSTHALSKHKQYCGSNAAYLPQELANMMSSNQRDMLGLHYDSPSIMPSLLGGHPLHQREDDVIVNADLRYQDSSAREDNESSSIISPKKLNSPKAVASASSPLDLSINSPAETSHIDASDRNPSSKSLFKHFARGSPYLPVSFPPPHPLFLSHLLALSHTPLLPPFSPQCFLPPPPLGVLSHNPALTPPNLFAAGPDAGACDHSSNALSSNNSQEKYTCAFCRKVFPRSANLTRHLRTHTGEQPYQCSFCERSFSISSNLQRHIRNIHTEVEWDHQTLVL